MPDSDRFPEKGWLTYTIYGKTASVPQPPQARDNPCQARPWRLYNRFPFLPRCSRAKRSRDISRLSGSIPKLVCHTQLEQDLTHCAAELLCSAPLGSWLRIQHGMILTKAPEILTGGDDLPLTLCYNKDCRHVAGGVCMED